MLPTQLRALELPWEKQLKVLEADLAMVVELCLQQSSSPPGSADGLVLEFTIEPARQEAEITAVRVHEGSTTQPRELIECVQAIAGQETLPMEIADNLDGGVFTLDLGRPRGAAKE